MVLSRYNNRLINKKQVCSNLRMKMEALKKNAISKKVINKMCR
jgi:hypothetical protein